MKKQDFLEYCFDTHGTSPDYPFDEDFETAVLRHKEKAKQRSSKFMKTVTFNVLVDNGGELYVDIDVTEKEFTLLKKFSTKYYDCDEDSEEFENCEKLSNLYARIKNDAYDEMANGAYDDDNLIAEFCDGEYDFDKMRAKIVENFNITIEWPEIDDKD